MRKNKIVNLTPHEIAFFRNAEDTEPEFTIEPSGRVARLEEQTADDTFDRGLCSIPCVVKQYREKVLDLPESNPDTTFIVSQMVLSHCKGRLDLAAPDTGTGVKRDDSGRIVGTTRFVVNPVPDFAF